MTQQKRMKNQETPVAVEGIPFIAAGVVVTLILALLSLKIAAAVVFAVTAFVVFFFRNPERSIPTGDGAVIAPADGVVIYSGRAYEEHLGAECLKISIFMSVFNVHVNRAPVTGTVEDSFYIKGKFLDVRHEKATFENEQAGLVIRSDAGWRMVVVQVAGLIARRIVTYVVPGDRLVTGERYGLIRFGSRLDVYLPEGSEISIALGDRTVAGETILGFVR